MNADKWTVQSQYIKYQATPETIRTRLCSGHINYIIIADTWMDNRIRVRYNRKYINYRAVIIKLSKEGKNMKKKKKKLPQWNLYKRPRGFFFFFFFPPHTSDWSTFYTYGYIIIINSMKYICDKIRKFYQTTTNYTI